MTFRFLNLQPLVSGQLQLPKEQTCSGSWSPATTPFSSSGFCRDFFNMQLDRVRRSAEINTELAAWFVKEELSLLAGRSILEVTA